MQNPPMEHRDAELQSTVQSTQGREGHNAYTCTRQWSVSASLAPLWLLRVVAGPILALDLIGGEKLAILLEITVGDRLALDELLDPLPLAHSKRQGLRSTTCGPSLSYSTSVTCGLMMQSSQGEVKQLLQGQGKRRTRTGRGGLGAATTRSLVATTKPISR